MTDHQSPSELERDANRARAELADTAEHLRDKMSPGQLMDEVVNYFKDGDTNQLFSNLKVQVRDNPMALAMVGGGLAWLMMGSGPSTGGHRMPARPGPQWANGPSVHTNGGGAYSGSSASSNGSSSSGIASSIGESASGLKNAASNVAEGVNGAASSAADAASATMHDIRDAAHDSYAYAADVGADLGARAKSTFLDALEREPLVIGALGVAVGAAIGAMLPTTRTEQAYIGAASAQARQTAETALSDGIDKARHVAKDVYSAARDEADRQGLTSTGKPLAAKVTDVAKAAGGELKAAAGHSIQTTEQTLDKKTDSLTPSLNKNA